MIITKAADMKRALALLREGFMPAAGFTNILVNVKKEKYTDDARFVDISDIEELRRIEGRKDEVVIGGAATFADIAAFLSECGSEEFKALKNAAENVGGPQTRNRGTIGGNLADASPSADSVPALMALDAVLRLVSFDGERRMNANDFFLGYRKTALKKDEIIADITLKRRGGRSVYMKVGKRNALAIAIAGTAVWIREENGVISDIRAAMSSVAPTAVRLKSAEAELCGKAPSAELFLKAATLVKADICPIDDMRAAAGYRGAVSENLLAACLETLTEVRA